MKFTEHLSSHLTPEWRKQYINYEILKEFLYKCVGDKQLEKQEVGVISFEDCDEAYFAMCMLELKKINNFFSEKLSEAKRKADNLFEELKSFQKNTEAKRFGSSILATRKSRQESVRQVDGITKRRVSVVDNLRETRLKKIRVRQKYKTLHDLKLGFSEFYLSLILLQNYQSLNFTGFRKILKKHDKLFVSTTGVEWRKFNVDKSLFNTNREVDDIILQVETVYTQELESGDRQKAMKRLRVPPLAEQHDPLSNFRLGFFLGVFVVQIALLVFTICFYYDNLPVFCVPAVRIFRSTFLLIFFMFLIGVNVYYWRSNGVNHVLIFEIDPRHHLSPIEIMEKSFQLLVIWGCCVIYFIFAPVFKAPAYLGPFLIVIILLIYLFNPIPIFNYNSRFWFLSILKRIFAAPMYTVQFADFWLADQLNSLSFLFVDIGYYVCFFGFYIEWTKGFMTSADLVEFTDDYIFNPETIPIEYNKTTVSRIDNNACNTLWYGLNPLLKSLPAWFRLAQCVRRYYDNYSKTHHLFPHIVNAGKYASSILVVIASALYSQYSSYKFALSILLTSCIANTVYCCGWDILMDWGLFDRNAQEDKMLRDELVYRYRIYYYLAMVEDVIGRMMWVILILLHKFPQRIRDYVLCVVMLIEVLRRFIWNFFRLENEHLNNCGEFRAVRDIFIAPIKLERHKFDIPNGKAPPKINISGVDSYDKERKANAGLMKRNDTIEILLRKDSMASSIATADLANYV